MCAIIDLSLEYVQFDAFDRWSAASAATAERKQQTNLVERAEHCFAVEMDKIKSLKEKYDAPTDGELNNAFRTLLPRMADTVKDREQHLSGLNTKLQELQTELAIKEESLNAEKQILNGKIQDMVACNSRLNELEADRNALLQEVHQLEIQRTNLRNRKPSTKDQQTLDHGKKKFQYYKLLTGIRWDFGAPEGTTKGYVTNGKDHIHTFNYQDKECGSELGDLLWKDIARGTRLEIERSDSKENKIPNE